MVTIPPTQLHCPTRYVVCGTAPQRGRQKRRSASYIGASRATTASAVYRVWGVGKPCLVFSRFHLSSRVICQHARLGHGKRLNCTYEIRRRRRRRTEKIIREREGEEFDIHSVGSASAHRAAISPLHMEWLHKRIYSQKNTNHDLLANIPLGWHR